MQIKRLFTTSDSKGTRNYINSQKKYESIRTLIYFGISIALFIAGYIQTGDRINLLTIVAVLGCLPASKSLVSAIMFLRYKSCSEDAASLIEGHCADLNCLYDMVFTSYKKNYTISHLAVRGNTVCGFSEEKNFEENEFYKHIGDILKLDGHKDVTVKIFTDINKYTARLDQLTKIEDAASTESISNTLKSVAL